MALTRVQHRPAAAWLDRRPLRPRPPAALPGLSMAATGVLLAIGVHRVVPAVPMLTASVLLGIGAAQLPATRRLAQGVAKPGLALAGKRLMRVGVVLLGLKLSVSDVAGLGWATVAMVLTVVAATFGGTYWLGRRMGLPGDQPLLVATGYSICGASAIGAVSQVAGSEEEDIAGSVALVTLCGTLAIAVLPLLHAPLGLDGAQFGRWVGASVHDVGQVVATAQTAGPVALREAVLVKLMRVALLAPLVAGVGIAARRSRGPRPVGAARVPLLPLFVAGFLAMIVLRSTGLLGAGELNAADQLQQLVLAAALFGLGAAVNLRTMVRTGGRLALLGLASWVVVAGVSYAGVLLTT
ncbi:putative sulfate exporter family transporter [Kitasatospora sp. NBC_01287]|uniref:YeiH family protein n=1 Tax=Kitasatospora sp. NBC_01287 TaxID=2903573 RepID=UPI00225172A5|nr:putative sulfate exporter family transporter [Kitasatospora sp. NBC_01287]MCX4750634.1 putative sulfate exporter family transporter [Kitasatospora sp. NBC_01287]